MLIDEEIVGNAKPQREDAPDFLCPTDRDQTQHGFLRNVLGQIRACPTGAQIADEPGLDHGPVGPGTIAVTGKQEGIGSGHVAVFSVKRYGSRAP